jgi:hypothetical protein
MDAGRTGKRLDELTTARLIGKAAERLHAAQQLAGPGKAVGPVTPAAIAIGGDGTVTLELDKKASALAYSAPEQLNGGAGDRRSDVFSLGCVMWEALTHQRLFEAMNEVAVKLAVSEREIKSPSEINANIPAELSAMCMKALSRTGADRYGSAKAMGVEIEEFLSEAGYDDTNEKIVACLTGMKKPPPPSILKAERASAQAEPIKLPSLTPGAPERAAAAAMAVAPTSPSPGNNFAKKLASAETKPVVAAPSAEPLVAKPMPAPPVLPAILTEKPTAPASPAALSDAAATKPAAPSAIAGSLPPIESVAAFAPNATDAATHPLIPHERNLKATISAAVPPPPALLGSAGATIPDGTPVVRESPITPPPDPAAPERSNAEGSAPHAANPVDAVSLPTRAHRDSEQVLNKWAWQTDSNAVVVDDEDFHAPPSRKPLYYAMGAGCAVAAIVVIIALASGGSSTPKKPPPTAAKESAEPAPSAAPAPAPTPEPAPAPAGSDTASAAQPAVAAQEPPKQEPPPAPEPPKQAPPPPPEPPKQEPPKQEPPKPVVVKAEPPRQAPPKQAPPKQEPPKQAPPKQVAKAEPPKAAPKADTEAAYKQGLQQFARGDTQGALASLRTSLAGNPNYPPTWRGLGLVFEKLGEKDQARAAFKRYLQLAPGASDSEQIKNRMEKLGS